MLFCSCCLCCRNLSIPKALAKSCGILPWRNIGQPRCVGSNSGFRWVQACLQQELCEQGGNAAVLPATGLGVAGLLWGEARPSSAAESQQELCSSAPCVKCPQCPRTQCCHASGALTSLHVGFSPCPSLFLTSLTPGALITLRYFLARAELSAEQERPRASSAPETSLCQAWKAGSPRSRAGRTLSTGCSLHQRPPCNRRR